VTTKAVLRRRAPAKVNLTLLLTGLREDGYHLLDSLVVFADIADDVSATASDALCLTVDGPFAEGVPTDERNLVLKAAERLRALRGVTSGAALHLTKNLPHGGGIGGGSSDAAATIHLLAELWKVAPLTSSEALSIGADLPVCLAAPHATMMRGIGEDLTPTPYQPKGALVLVNPRAVVPTGQVFALHDRLYPFSTYAQSMKGVDDAESFEIWLKGQRNDLTKVVREDGVAPVIGDVLDALRPHAVDCDMSGSGSTCWGWFHDDASAVAAASAIGKDHPDWWVQAARILP